MLLLSQRKFWFEEDAERKIGKVIASVPIDKTNVEVVDSEVAEGAEETGPVEVVEDPSESSVPEGADWRDAQYRGIGLGISFSGLNSMVLSYDYNSSPDTQWHLQLDLTGPMVQSWFSALQMWVTTYSRMLLSDVL